MSSAPAKSLLNLLSELELNSATLYLSYKIVSVNKERWRYYGYINWMEALERIGT